MQIGFDEFNLKFWPLIKKNIPEMKNISSIMVWTEIFSFIKGSHLAHEYPNWNLSYSKYIHLISDHRYFIT